MLEARNLVTRDGELTVAALLLFGSEPQRQFPNAHVRVVAYADKERGSGARLTMRDDADVRCEGSIPQQIVEADATISRLIPRRRALAASGRFEGQPIIPREAWLEGLVNAVLHRSYSMAGDHTRVEIFPDRIEITSPGRFPGLADPRRPLDVARYARNPRIARVCSDLGIAQELGEGIRRIFDEMRARSYADPVYVQSSSSVRLTLAAVDAVDQGILNRLRPGARRALDILRIAERPLGTGQVADAIGVTRPTTIRYLESLKTQGLIVWDGASPKDPRAVWRVR